MAKEKDLKERIKVVATQDGYYQHVRRREGDVFLLIPVRTSAGKVVSAEEQFSKKWMERVSLQAKVNVSTSKQKLQEDHDSIIRERMGLNDPDDAPAGEGEVGSDEVL